MKKINALEASKEMEQGLVYFLKQLLKRNVQIYAHVSYNHHYDNNQNTFGIVTTEDLAKAIESNSNNVEATYQYLDYYYDEEDQFGREISKGAYSDRKKAVDLTKLCILISDFELLKHEKRKKRKNTVADKRRIEVVKLSDYYFRKYKNDERLWKPTRLNRAELVRLVDVDEDGIWSLDEDQKLGVEMIESHIKEIQGEYKKDK